MKKETFKEFEYMCGIVKNNVKRRISDRTTQCGWNEKKQEKEVLYGKSQ